MTCTRRRFLHLSAATAGLGLVAPRAAAAARGIEVRAARSKRILVLGGTYFLGPAIVDAALARGHELTLFNRGKTNPTLFPDVEKLRGNRNPDQGGGLEALRDRDWDVVIDTWAGTPRFVRDSAQLLADHAEQYIYTSSIAVYGDYQTVGITETSPLRPVPPLSENPDAPLPYPTCKILGERAAASAMPERVTIPRAGSICGRRLDASSDNQRYWPVRVHRGGEVLAPGTGRDPVQYIDVLDLARWVVRAAEQDLMGIFNTVGPLEKLTMSDYLHGIKAITTGEARFTWVSEEFLRAKRVESFTRMPMWAPLSEDPGFFQISNRKAVESGLTFRSHADSMKDILQGFLEREPPSYEFGPPGSEWCISAAREKELLVEWNAARQQVPNTPAGEKK